VVYFPVVDFLAVDWTVIDFHIDAAGVTLVRIGWMGHRHSRDNGAAVELCSLVIDQNHTADADRILLTEADCRNGVPAAAENLRRGRMIVNQNPHSRVLVAAGDDRCFDDRSSAADGCRPAEAVDCRSGLRFLVGFVLAAMRRCD
jgi:hypothetical protein